MAPKLRPGTPFHVRGGGTAVEARTDRSKWHNVLRWWGGHHLDRDSSGEWRDNSGWASSRGQVARSSTTRQQRREDARIAAHAQSLREEAYTMGGKTERAMFYGSGEHRGAGVESKVRTSAADVTQDADARVRRYYRVAYRDAAGAQHSAAVGAFSPGQARRTVKARPGVARVIGVTEAL